MEIDWFFESAAAVERAGDVYELKLRLTEGAKKFKGIAAFEEKAVAWNQKLVGEEVARQIRAGALYHKIALGSYDKKMLARYMAQFLKKHEGTIYADAVKPGLEDEKGNLFTFFFMKNPALRKYDYPTRPAPKK